MTDHRHHHGTAALPGEFVGLALYDDVLDPDVPHDHHHL
jgi:hypothetical protein